MLYFIELPTSPQVLSSFSITEQQPAVINGVSNAWFGSQLGTYTILNWTSLTVTVQTILHNQYSDVTQEEKLLAKSPICSLFSRIKRTTGTFYTSETHCILTERKLTHFKHKFFFFFWEYRFHQHIKLDKTIGSNLVSTNMSNWTRGMPQISFRQNK